MKNKIVICGENNSGKTVFALRATNSLKTKIDLRVEFYFPTIREHSYIGKNFVIWDSPSLLDYSHLLDADLIIQVVDNDKNLNTHTAKKCRRFIKKCTSENLTVVVLTAFEIFRCESPFRFISNIFEMNRHDSNISPPPNHLNFSSIPSIEMQQTVCHPTITTSPTTSTTSSNYITLLDILPTTPTTEE